VDGGTTPVANANAEATWNAATVHMWTDNALVKTAGAFLLAALSLVVY